SNSAPTHKVPFYFHQKEVKGVALILSSLYPRLPRAATRGAQLIATTSSPKRRKVSPEPRSSPGRRARRQGRSEPPHSRHASSSSRRCQSLSLSPPRYVPAHLQFQSSSPPGRSLTRVAATAGHSRYIALPEMPSDAREGTPPTDVRSPSPGEKRPASEIVDSDPEGGVSTNDFDTPLRVTSTTYCEYDERYKNRLASYDGAGSPLPSEKSEPESPKSSPKSDDLPTVDEQVAQVNALMQAPLKEGQKGYAISMSWLKQVLARTTSHADHADQASLGAGVGPVNNLNIMLDTDHGLPPLKDENGETFVPLKPGLHDALDFTVIPQHGWDLIQKWYGIAEDSPVIVRYAHNVSQAGDAEKVQYEIYPPIYTIFKLSNPAAVTTPTVLKERNKSAVRILASRYTNFQKWLKDAKEQAGIDISTKVRIWNILRLPHSTNASTSTTPAASRTQSPAPSALIPHRNDKLLFDLNSFLELTEGTHRELLTHLKDQTQNPNYNGRMTLDIAGLGDATCLVLEEQVGGSKGAGWVSEVSAKTLKSLGIPVAKTDIAPKVPAAKAAVEASKSSGRSTPESEADPISSILARGRNRHVITGLINLGNTCYMNSALQCVRSVQELSYYFLSDTYKRELNPQNVLSCGGIIAKQYATLVKDMFKPIRYANTSVFKRAAGRFRDEFSGTDQQDSQEFVMFLLDALSEDLSRIVGKKPATTIPDSTDEMINDRKALEEFGQTCWDLYEARNASVITDLFAGMYKSTLHHHGSFHHGACARSGGANMVNRPIVFSPPDGPPVVLKVRLDANGTLKTWKDFVAAKMGIEGERIFIADVHKHAFFSHFDDDNAIWSRTGIAPRDNIVFFDLGPLPESAQSPDSASAKEDGIIVPIFHRRLKNAGPSRELFGVPSLIRLTAEETRDLEKIYRKILGQANNMTTRDIYDLEAVADDESAADDSDTVVTNEDDARSADSRIKASSVDDGDSIVNISMQNTDKPAQEDAESESDSGSQSIKSPQHPLSGKIPANLLTLFGAKVMSTNDHIPHGRDISPTNDYTLLTSRIPSPPASSKGSDNSSNASADGNSDDDNDTDDSEPGSGLPLLRQGDAILLDWTPDAVDALFGGKQHDPSEVRGRPTYLDMPTVFDHGGLGNQRQLQRLTVSLDNCLDDFSKEEVLSKADSWFCPQCKTHVAVTKKLELWKTPDILVIQLKRFKFSESRFDRRGIKLNTLVDFPLEGLDLSKRVVGPDDPKGAVYDLIAIDRHVGSLNGGHYTAHIKDFVSGKWVFANDSQITYADKRSLVAEEAYLLFYRRRSDRPLGNSALRDLVESYQNKNTPGSDYESSTESCSSSRPQSPCSDGSEAGSVEAPPRLSRGQDSLGNDLYSPDEESTDSSEDSDSEGKKVDFEHESQPSQAGPLGMLAEPSWSFDDAHADLQMVNPDAEPNDDNLEETRSLGEPVDIDPSLQYELTPGGEEDDSSDELPVVELHVESEDAKS
ncbi:Peptidase C19 ubiquitin carboxyl-terminal hydrolase 2, partial [Penicillium sp. DV-2018c]